MTPGHRIEGATHTMTIATQLKNHLDRTNSTTIVAVDEGHWDAIAELLTPEQQDALLKRFPHDPPRFDRDEISLDIERR